VDYHVNGRVDGHAYDRDGSGHDRRGRVRLLPPLRLLRALSRAGARSQSTLSHLRHHVAQPPYEEKRNEGVILFLRERYFLLDHFVCDKERVLLLASIEQRVCLRVLDPYTAFRIFFLSSFGALCKVQGRHRGQIFASVHLDRWKMGQKRVVFGCEFSILLKARHG
jgi:hypothetical protein